MGSVEFFFDHCYSVLWDNRTKYFDNKDDDSDTETSNDLPKFTDGIKVRNRNQYNLVPGPVLRILDHTAFPTEKSADIEICDEEFDSLESAHQQTQEDSPTEVHTTEDVPVAADVHEISEDYDMEIENKSWDSLRWNWWRVTS